MPLLHYCAELGILNPNLVKLLAHQIDEEFYGQLAIELGILDCKLYLCKLSYLLFPHPAIANGNRDSALLLKESLCGSNILRLFDASGAEVSDENSWFMVRDSDVSKTRKVIPYGRTVQMTSDMYNNEDLRCELFNLLASDEHQLQLMKEMRRVIVQVQYP